ncbi:hypothetical protein BCV71DRAFT_181034 [Rhizopus microsporus]|uniref:Uncharacterized protein n=1 Tax=Rhizopus microsporus TaxID=58291 RepID=A0A1X0S0B1_RHIZD|nr:hypothetical protein BCV71DRAFT_181034 [Rhizopus microsporus]
MPNIFTRVDITRWCEKYIGWSFWCRVVAICLNLWFMWKISVDLYTQSTRATGEAVVAILIDCVVFLCLMTDFLTLTAINIMLCTQSNNLVNSVEPSGLVTELCRLSTTVQYLDIMVSGLRDYLLCALYIFTAHFNHLALVKSAVGVQQTVERVPMSDQRNCILPE